MSVPQASLALYIVIFPSLLNINKVRFKKKQTSGFNLINLNTVKISEDKGQKTGIIFQDGKDTKAFVCTSLGCKKVQEKYNFQPVLNQNVALTPCGN